MDRESDYNLMVEVLEKAVPGQMVLHVRTGIQSRGGGPTGRAGCDGTAEAYIGEIIRLLRGCRLEHNTYLDSYGIRLGWESG